MLSDELKGIRESLGDLLGKLKPADADYLRQVRRNLDAAADQAAAMENNLCVMEAK